jgi:hypothetical protein
MNDEHPTRKIRGSLAIRALEKHARLYDEIAGFQMRSLRSADALP